MDFYVLGITEKLITNSCWSIFTRTVVTPSNSQDLHCHSALTFFPINPLSRAIYRVHDKRRSFVASGLQNLHLSATRSSSVMSMAEGCPHPRYQIATPRNSYEHRVLRLMPSAFFVSALATIFYRNIIKWARNLILFP